MRRHWHWVPLLLILTATGAHAAGSLATSAGSGTNAGIASGQPDTIEAERLALLECGSNCRVFTDFAHTCAALASPPHGPGGWVAVRRSRVDAQTAAISAYQEHGTEGCDVKLWACDP
jgi:hypothetical protein